MIKSLLLASLATLFFLEDTKHTDLSKEEHIIANIKVASVDLEIGSVAMNYAYMYSFFGKNSEATKHKYSLFKNGTEGYLSIRRNIGDATQRNEDSRFDFSDLFGDDSDEGNMQLLLSKSLPVSLDVTASTGTSIIDLTGLKLRNFSMNLGAGDAIIQCKKKNDIETSEFNISIGAATAELRGLGNLNAKKINASTSAGRLLIDFSGNLTTETNVDIDVTAGFVDIVAPKDFGVKVMLSGKLLSSISFPSMNASSDGKVYTNRNYGYSKASIVINLNVGAGKVKMSWK